MKIYKTQAEVEKDIKNGVLAIEGDVKFECSISIMASIVVTDGNITAWDITAWDITAWNITAGDISFYAVCSAYSKFICKSIKGRRENSKYFSLDGEVEFKDTPIEIIEIGGIKYDKSEVEKALKDIKAVK